MISLRSVQRGFCASLVVAIAASLSTTAAAAQSVETPVSDDLPSAALVLTSPFGDQIDTTVDLCDDEGATAWGLDAGRLETERARLGLDCAVGPVIGQIDMYGESTVGVDAVRIPAPVRAPVDGSDAHELTELPDHNIGFFDTILGFYSTEAERPGRSPGVELASLEVVGHSIHTTDDTVRGLVRNNGTQLARDVTLTLGASQTTLALPLQPGERAGFVLDRVTPLDRSGEIAQAITVTAELADEADFGRAVALSETFASSPDRPEVLVTTARPDNVALPEDFDDGFAIVDVTAVVTSLDRRGRVLDVSPATLLGEDGAGGEELVPTDRIDAALGMQVLQASTPAAAALIVNVGGTPIARSTPDDSDAAFEEAAMAAGYSSIKVTSGTYRGVMGGIDALYTSGRGCAAVSKPRLASVLFAIPAHELGGWQPPSPASFSRGDNMAVDARNERLYSFARNNGKEARAFWSPGIGIYQLDTLNLTVGAYAKANTRRATILVGGLLLDRWCDGGTKAMRSFLSRTWFACANDACYSTAQALYDASRNRLQNVSKTPGNSITGGVKSRFCWSGDRPKVYVRCQFFDISALQGEMNQIALNGGAGPNPYTPVPADFVELTISTDKGRAEARVFMTGNTGYGREIWAIRPLGTNPRTSLKWYSQTWKSFNKDLSVWSCRNLSDTNRRCSWSTTRAR